MRPSAALRRPSRSRASYWSCGPDAPGGVHLGVDLRWLGPVSHEEMPVLYGAADVVVLPAVGPEALSRVPLEAALAGRPTIGTRVGGIPEEIVDGQTGHLVPPGDAKALAVALDGLLRDDTLRTAMGENARRFVAERFDPDAVVRSLLDVYRAAGR